MRNYRTKSLFHYTQKLDSIVHIIETRCLCPNYCGEDLSTTLYPNTEIGIPMICFCDIPVSLSNFFVKYYGKYAIGFRKEWGIQNKCNPIQYINNEKIIDGMLFYRKMSKEYLDSSNSSDATFDEKMKLFFRQENSHSARTHIFGYVKKYMGEWKGLPYCNYDENEWRYVVEEGFQEIWWKWEQGEYQAWRGDKKKKKPKPTSELKSVGLHFELSDINHIILYEESKIPIFLNKLNRIREKGSISEDDFAILVSKVTSFDRIKDDF